MTPPSRVYLIHDPDRGLVKIGIATDLQRRLAQLQTGNGSPLEVVDHWPCPTTDLARRVERAAHHVLSAHRVQGEWFMVSPSLGKRILGRIMRAYHTPAAQDIDGPRAARHMHSAVLAVQDQLDQLQHALQEHGLTAEEAAWADWAKDDLLGPELMTSVTDHFAELRESAQELLRRVEAYHDRLQTLTLGGNPSAAAPRASTSALRDALLAEAMDTFDEPITTPGPTTRHRAP